MLCIVQSKDLYIEATVMLVSHEASCTKKEGDEVWTDKAVAGLRGQVCEGHEGPGASLTCWDFSDP